MSYRDAQLRRERLGFGIGLGYRDAVRFEARLFGVSASVVQDEVDGYRPPEEEGAWADVPGAGGLGQGMWSLRLEFFDYVAGSFGRVSDQAISHRVGWEEEFDEDGDSLGLSEAETTHWSSEGSGHWFATVGVPRWAMSDIVLGPDSVESLGLRSGWLRPTARWPLLRGAARWDGLTRQPVGELGVSHAPLSVLPALRFSLLTAGEFAHPRLRELSATARYGLTIDQLTDEFHSDLELLVVEARTGLYGGARLEAQTGGAVVPGVHTSASVAVPFFAVIRLGGFVGVNRPDTLAMVPDATGRLEWGMHLYTTYAF